VAAIFLFYDVILTMPLKNQRKEKLERYRMAKMARSCDDFVRGNTKQFYRWLESCSSLPDGPSIWICGDCHMGNLGPICGANGEIHVEIRDFDQTVIGNPAYDLVRLEKRFKQEVVVIRAQKITLY
jgi:uncharacterized protein (DUF2252 family)